MKSRHIPHYIIESRNLFNSKMTEKMSKEIVEQIWYDTCLYIRCFRAWLTCYLWCTVLSHKNTFTTQSSCVYLNMFAYCLIKARHHRQSAKFILQSLRTFPSRYNANCSSNSEFFIHLELQIFNAQNIQTDRNC